MEDASKREKFLFWLVKNSEEWWIWLPVLLVSSALINAGSGLLGGLGLILWGVLTFAAGINFALESTLGVDYAKKDLRKKNADSK